MSLGLLFAFLAPIGWSIAVLIDKYILVHKVKSTWSYSAVTGLVTLAFAAILTLFFDWSTVTLAQLVFPALTGIMVGIFTFAYLFTLEQEDASSISGFFFLYPALAGLLAFFMLHERIPWLGYTGMIITLFGVALLVRRQLKIRKGTQWWLISIAIVSLSLKALFSKVAVASLPPLQAYSISAIIEGIILFAAILHPLARKHFIAETRVTLWAIISEVWNWGAYAASFIALTTLPVAIVVSIASIMPVTLLLLERILDAMVGRIVRDHVLLPRLGPLVLIAIGIALLGIAGYQ